MKRSFLALVLIVLSSLACGLFSGGGPTPLGATAQPAWEAQASKPNSYSYANGLFYALGSQLVARGENSGKVVWQADASSYRLSEDGNLAYVASGGACSMLDAVSGRVVQRVPTERAYLCDPSRPDEAAANFILNDDGSVSASDASSGKALWTTPLGLTFSSIFNSPAGFRPYDWNGYVIVDTSSFRQGDPNTSYLNFLVLDAGSGRAVWQVADKPNGMALVSGDRVVLAYQDVLKALPTTSGAPIPVPSGPFQLVARDLSTGQERWHVVTEAAEGYYEADGVIYQCNQGNWRWFDRQTGKLLGEQKGVASAYTTSCPNGSNHFQPSVEVGADTWLVRAARTSADNGNFENPTQDGWYTAFQLSTGQAAWSTDVLIHGQPAIGAMGRQMVLIIEGDKIKAYRLAGK